MRFDIDFDNLITRQFPDATERCNRNDAPFDICGGCVAHYELDTPTYEILEIEHPPFSEPGIRYSCAICKYRIY